MQTGVHFLPELLFYITGWWTLSLERYIGTNLNRIVAVFVALVAIAIVIVVFVLIIYFLKLKAEQNKTKKPQKSSTGKS